MGKKWHAVKQSSGEKILITVERWFETRQRLSHDVLKNRVLVAFGTGSHGSLDVAALEPYLRLFTAQEQGFRNFLTEASIVLRPGSWLVEWMGNSMDGEAAAVLSEFLNMDFERTSLIPGKIKEIENMLEYAINEARRVLESHSIDVDNGDTDVKTLIGKLSDALTELPSTMQGVVESMK